VNTCQIMNRRYRRFQYWLGYVIGTWQCRIKPRMNIQFVRGYIAGRLGR
jgi:hypothetical protein